MNGRLTNSEFAFLKGALKALEAFGQRSLNGDRRAEVEVINFFMYNSVTEGRSRGTAGVVADLGILIDKIEKIES